MSNVPPNSGPPPPPPPPHGSNPKTSSGLPNGHYDIFIVPPHSAGGGFLYLPSMKPNVNSYIAGVVSALAAVYAWFLIQPIIKAWIQAVSQSGAGFGIIVVAGLAAFVTWMMAQSKLPGVAGGASGNKPNGAPPPHNAHGNGSAGAGPEAHWGSSHSSNAGQQSGARGPAFGTQGPSGSVPGFGASPHHQYKSPFEESPPTGPQRDPTPEPYTEDSPTGRKNDHQGSASWEKAKEETRKREEERLRQDNLKRKQDEEKKRKENAEREARAAAEKERWEQLRAREKENRERELREKQARERMAKSAQDLAEKEAKEKADRDARLKAAAARAERLRAERASEKASSERAKSEKAVPTFGVGERLNPYSREHAAPKSTIGAGAGAHKPEYRHPTAQTYVGTATETGYRPYENTAKTVPNGTYYAASTDSHPGSESTAPTSPSRSYTGPYTTKDPDKIILQGAFEFNDNFPNAPVAAARPGENKITDGLIMIFSTEGIFLNDDRRDEKLRSWDVKAWTVNAIDVSDVIYADVFHIWQWSLTIDRLLINQPTLLFASRS